jgi:hypothetical protein
LVVSRAELADLERHGVAASTDTAVGIAAR